MMWMGVSDLLKDGGSRTLGEGRGDSPDPRCLEGWGRGLIWHYPGGFGQNGKDRGTARNASRMVRGGVELSLKAWRTGHPFFLGPGGTPL